MSDADSTAPEGETPPEPEPEGFREQVMSDEADRKKRAAEAFDQRSADAKLYYKGIANEGDAPGSALAGQEPEDATPESGPVPEPQA